MKLTDIPVIFICPDHNDKYRERKLYMFDFLTKLGFKHVSMFKSGSESYPRSLNKATLDILSCRMDDHPFLLLEDDIMLSDWAHADMEIDVPEDTDAFYLGISRYAASHVENHSKGWDSYEVENKSDKHVRILNMLTTHAILYISKRYKQAVAQQMEFAMNTSELLFNDVLITRVQPKFNVYSYRYPFFYQSSGFQNDPRVCGATNFRF